jgi:hypothetical protein
MQGQWKITPDISDPDIKLMGLVLFEIGYGFSCDIAATRLITLKPNRAVEIAYTAVALLCGAVHYSGDDFEVAVLDCDFHPPIPPFLFK